MYSGPLFIHHLRGKPDKYWVLFSGASKKKKKKSESQEWSYLTTYAKSLSLIHTLWLRSTWTCTWCGAGLPIPPKPPFSAGKAVCSFLRKKKNNPHFPTSSHVPCHQGIMTSWGSHLNRSFKGLLLAAGVGMLQPGGAQPGLP